MHVTWRCQKNLFLKAINIDGKEEENFLLSLGIEIALLHECRNGGKSFFNVARAAVKDDNNNRMNFRKRN